MKKNIALILAAVMMTAVVGCSKKKADTTDSSVAKNEVASTQTAEADSTTTTETADSTDVTSTATADTATTDTATTEVAGTAVENASKEVDMDKVPGKEVAEIETEADEALIGNYEVSIEDAKVIDYNDEKVIVVSFDFENKTSSPIAFDGAMTVDIFQNDAKLRGAVVTGIEGVNINSAFEIVKSGDDITLQKAYVLEDESTPVDVSVYKYGEADRDTVTKTFNLQ